MIHRRSWILALMVSASLAWTVSPALAEQHADQRASYPLKKIVPKGFSLFDGVLDWVPVSSKRAVAFAGNRTAGFEDLTLRSFTLADTGVASPSITVASGLGRPRAVACVWDTDGTIESQSGAGHGLVFALFHRWYSDADPYHEDMSVYVAKFNASGRVVGSWRQLLTIDSGDDAYFPNQALHLARSGDSVGVVPSCYVQGPGSVHAGAFVYFIEVKLEDGSPIGQPVRLPTSQSGRFIDAIGHEPASNGTTWLVPVDATQYKSPGTWSNLSQNKALVYSVTGDASHTVASSVVAKDSVAEYRPYEDMCLTLYPGSPTDFLLFLKQTIPFPEGQRGQDYSDYKFTMKRLNQRGTPAKSLALSVPALTHVVPADPAYQAEWATDHWSRFIARGDTLYVSRAHDMTLWKGDDSVSEQQFNLYALDPVMGQVELVANSFLRQKDGLVLPPIARPFSSSRFGVVNSLWLNEQPYRRLGYFSLFEH